MNSPPAQHVQQLGVEILRDIGSFEALRQEWDDLYHHCPSATPFQSWAWLFSWWEHYGEGYELRLLTVREEGGLLVGMVPLMLERVRGIFGRLLFVGTGTTDYQDLLAREGWEREVYWVAVDALRKMENWQVADLQELRPDALAWGLYERWSKARSTLPQSECPTVSVKPWEEVLGSLSRNHRSTTRRTLRKMEADGISTEIAGPEEASRAARQWVALHREAWQGREIQEEHLSARFEGFLHAAARRITQAGLGGISEFRRDGEVVCSHFLVFGKDFVGAHLFGATREALKRYSVSSLYIWDGINHANRRKNRYLDLLRGEEEYKFRWSDGLTLNRRALLGRNALAWAFYASYWHLRARAQELAESGSTPRPVRLLLDRLRGR